MKLKKVFSKFHRRRGNFKFEFELKTPFQQSLTEQEFYDNLVDMINKRFFFLVSSEKHIICYKRIGYNINVKPACSVVNPIMVNKCASLFSCMSVDHVQTQ